MQSTVSSGYYVGGMACSLWRTALVLVIEEWKYTSDSSDDRHIMVVVLAQEFAWMYRGLDKAVFSLSVHCSNPLQLFRDQ